MMAARSDRARLSKMLRLLEEGVIEIDERGQVWKTVDRRSGKPSRSRAEWKSTIGYMVMKLSIDNVSVSVQSHRLVWAALRGSIPNG